MSDSKNFLEQINEEKKVTEQKEEKKHKKKKEEGSKKVQSLDSFKAETFVETKTKTKIVPYITLILLVLIVIAAYYFFTRETVVVVDFTGMELEQVEEWSDQNGVMLLSQDEYHKSIDEEKILGQNLEVGYSMKAEDTLVVKVSAGPDPYEVIDLPEFDSTWSKTSVQAWVESNNIDNFAFKYSDDESVEGDYLINYILTGADADTYSRSASLEFVFSQPEEAATVVMENFLGESLSSFDTWAVGEGFSYTYSEQYSEIYDEGEIMEQNFTPDMEKIVTDVLEVVVSKGVSDETVVMENLINMSMTESQAWLAENGLTIDIVKRYNDDFDEDKVISQSVIVGEEINKGSVVQVTVSAGEAIVVPDFSKYDYLNNSIASQQYDGYVLVSQQYDENVPVNQLISQSLTRGSVNDGDEPIEVIYSLGGNIIIPDFRSETVSEINEWINEQNELGATLSLNIVEDPELNEDYGVIFKQNYYNKSIQLDDTIEVVIATEKVVPDFSEMTLLEAENFADTASYQVVIEQLYQLDTDLDEFIWQSVSPDTQVDVNTLVLVRYSLGMKVIIDDYRDEPLSDLESAVMEYEDQGMDIKLNVIEQYDNDVPYGVIISQSLYSASVTTGDTIDVIVSLGESYNVQKFVGTNRSNLDDLIEALGLNVVYIEEESDATSGTVLRQSIEPGTVISRNEFIYLTVAK